MSVCVGLGSTDPSKKGIAEILVQAGDVQCGDHEIGYNYQGLETGRGCAVIYNHTSFRQ